MYAIANKGGVGDGGASPKAANAITLFEQAMSLCMKENKPKEALEVIKKIPTAAPMNDPGGVAAQHLVSLPPNTDPSPVLAGATAQELKVFASSFLDRPARLLFRRCQYMLDREEKQRELARRASATATTLKPKPRGAVVSTSAAASPSGGASPVRDMASSTTTNSANSNSPDNIAPRRVAAKTEYFALQPWESGLFGPSSSAD